MKGVGGNIVPREFSREKAEESIWGNCDVESRGILRNRGDKPYL
jgi:hypothetical protein